MQLDSTDYPSAATPDGLLHTASVIPNPTVAMTEESTPAVNEPTKFYTQYIDSMEMYADVATVAKYFDDHHAWFRRCAHPMQVEPIGQNGYALVIGRFGSNGYVVEPKIGLNLLPQDAGVYRIETIAVPGYVPAGYDVDFRAAMELVEAQPSEGMAQAPGEAVITSVTRVQWHLDLTVAIHFPRFIHRALPKTLLQSTGDRVLGQIVRQVSHRLNRKVLEDFHTTYNVPIPKHSQQRWFRRKPEKDTAE